MDDSDDSDEAGAGDERDGSTWTVELVVPDDSELDLAGRSKTIEIREDESILAAARNAGLWLPADCQQGWCVTCAARLLEGAVDQSSARRYYEEDREAGLILTCVAKPRSDLVVEVDQYRTMLEHRAENDRPPGRSKLG